MRPTKQRTAERARPSIDGSPELAEDHFRKLVRKRLERDSTELGVAPGDFRFKVAIPLEIRLDNVIQEVRRARSSGRPRRGRTLELETRQIIRTELHRLYRNQQDPTHPLSARQASRQFWTNLSMEARYEKYKVVVKDHKSFLAACLARLQ